MTVEEAYQSYRGGLLRYAVSISHSHEDGEDLVQKVFLRFIHAVRHEAIDEPKHWLIHSLRNLFIDHIKARRVRLKHGITEMPDVGDIDILITASYKEEFDETIFRDRRRALVRNSVKHLTAKQRQCIVLRGNGLTLLEISEKTGMDLRRVAEAISRAVPHIRQAVKEAETLPHKRRRKK